MSKVGRILPECYLYPQYLEIVGSLNEQLSALKMLQTENGLLKMRMESPLMERYQTDSLSYELFPKGIAVFGYNEEGLLETELTSDNARHLSYEDGRESWEAYGNVVVKNIINQEVMETDTLYWDRKNERLYTHCYVKLHSPDGFMQGFGMESDQRARESISSWTSAALPQAG